MTTGMRCQKLCVGGQLTLSRPTHARAQDGARRLAASLQLTAAGVRRIAVDGLTILWSVRGIVRARGTAGIVGRIVTKCIALQA